MISKAALFLLFFAFTTISADIVIDRQIPGTSGGDLACHVEAGTNSGDFHVTYEVEGEGTYYVYYDGSGWETRINVHTDRAFRSGTHMAIDNNNNVHFAWCPGGYSFTGSGGSDRNEPLKYRKLSGTVLSSIEIVNSSQGWNECDIAWDKLNSRPIIAANGNVQPEMCVYEKTGAIWTKKSLPNTVGSLDRWAPTIVCTDQGRIIVGYRYKDGHPFTYTVREPDMTWISEESSSRTYEPNAIPISEGLISASAQGNVQQLIRTADNTYFALVPSFGSVGYLRGVHCGLAMTSNSNLYVCYSNQTNSDIKDRTINTGDQYYYKISSDEGTKWESVQTVTNDNSGQGHGNCAANGNWVMFVWPDMRGGSIICATA